MSKLSLKPEVLKEFQDEIYDLLEKFSVKHLAPPPELMMSMLTIALIATRRGAKDKFKQLIADQADIVEKCFEKYENELKEKEEPKTEALKN